MQFLFIITALALNSLRGANARETNSVTLFSIADVDQITFLQSDSTATTYEYRSFCLFTPASLVSSLSSQTRSSASSLDSSTLTSTLQSLTTTTAPINSVIATATGSVTPPETPPTAVVTVIGSSTIPPPPNQKRETTDLNYNPSIPLVSSCSAANITQGPSTFHYELGILSVSGHRVVAQKTVDCKFGSGGLGTGSATCTETTSGIAESLNATTRMTTTYAPEEYTRSYKVVEAMTTGESTTTTTVQSTSSSTGGAGVMALPTERAMAFAGGAVGLLALGAGLVL